MYNKDVKDRFIEYQLNLSEGKKPDGLLAYYTNAFNRLEPFEIEVGKDLCDMSNNEIDCMLKKYLKGGKTYQSATLGVLSAYTDWAINIGVSTNSENYLAAKNVRNIDTSESYQNFMIRDENELSNILGEENVLEKEEMGSVDNLYRCYLHLLFAGIAPLEILELRVDAFDEKNKLIHTNHGNVAISETLCKLLVNFIALDSFHRYVGNMASRYDIINKTGFLLESTSKNKDLSDPKHRQKLRATWDTAVSKKMKGASKHLKQMNILLSGVFSRMYEKEKTTGEIDLTEYFNLKSGTALAIEAPRRLMAIGKNEYETWKKAFNLD